MAIPEMFDVLQFGITTGILGVTIIALWTQIRKQSKATSATLALEMLKRMRDEDFRDVVEKILNNTPEKCNSLDLDRVLNHFEYMAVFEEDGILEMNHIKEVYTPTLLKIKESPFIQNKMQGMVSEKPDYYFTHLRRLLQNIS